MGEIASDNNGRKKNLLAFLALLAALAVLKTLQLG